MRDTGPPSRPTAGTLSGLTPFQEPDRRQKSLFIVGLHWGIIALAPILTLLSGRATHPAVWYILGAFVLFTAALQALVGLRLPERALPALGFGVLIADLFLVTALVWARGGLASDTYHLYYLVIVGASILFGVREAVGFAAASGLLYGAVLWWDAGPGVIERVAIRTVYFVLIGLAAAYLSAREARQRTARVEVQRLLSEVQQAHTELKIHAREMSQRAVTDGLTGLYNHTYFHRRLEEELSRAARYGRPLSLLMMDLDDFKAYNDSSGHLAGDNVLARVAREITGCVRSVDVVCRYGGEEFAVIMPETDSRAAVAAAERIREVVAGSPAGVGEPIAGPDGSEGGPTVSIGVATYPNDAAGRVALVEAADRALYLSKKRGKNVVTVWTAAGSLHSPGR